MLAVRVSDDVQIARIEDLSQYRSNEVLSVFGSAASQFLKNKGLDIYDAPKTPHQALEMLMLNRGRFVFYHDLGLRSLIKDKGLESQIKLLPNSFKRYTHSIAFNKKVEPAKVRRVEKALSALEENGRLAEIRQKYGVQHAMTTE